jgi:hypothetical protein
MKIYKFNSASDSYEVVATISQEGIVTGDSPFAQRVRCVFEKAQGFSRSEFLDTALDLIERRYNTGYYSTER